MILLIGSILLFIGLFIYLGLYPVTKGEGYRQRDVLKFKLRGRQVLSILAFTLCLFNFFTIIPANTVGVQYSPFTGVREATLPEGMHTKGFFDKIYEISTQVQTKKIENIYGQTRDAQYITVVLDVKYQVNSANAFSVFRSFKNLRGIDENLITPTVQRSVETVTTNYDIIEVLGSRRNDIYKEIELELKTRLSANGIDLHSVTLVDTDAGDSIEKAIQDEAVAKKAVETAEQERNKAKIESEKRVIEAEADKTKAEVEAQTQIVKAKADAEAKIIEAEANAKAYEVMNKELTTEALNKMWIEKWNGTLPQFMSDGGGFLLNIPQK